MTRQVKEYWKKVEEAEMRLDDIIEDMIYLEGKLELNYAENMQYARLNTERNDWIDVRDYWLDEIAQIRGFEEWNDYAYHNHIIMMDVRAEQGCFVY